MNNLREMAMRSVELQEKELKIQSLIGLDLDTLIELFAKGYILEPPHCEHGLVEKIEEKR